MNGLQLHKMFHNLSPKCILFLIEMYENVQRSLGYHAALLM